MCNHSIGSQPDVGDRFNGRQNQRMGFQKDFCQMVRLGSTPGSGRSRNTVDAWQLHSCIRAWCVHHMDCVSICQWTYICHWPNISHESKISRRSVDWFDVSFGLLYILCICHLFWPGLFYRSIFYTTPVKYNPGKKEKKSKTEQRWSLFQYLCWLSLSTFVVFAVVVLFVAAQQNVGKCVSISTIALVGSTEEETMGVVPHKEVVCVVRGLHGCEQYCRSVLC